MPYKTVKILEDDDFNRSAGVNMEKAKMLANNQKEMRDFERTQKLDRCDQLLMKLVYWRDDMTTFWLRTAFAEFANE
jgi:hypothetical protein